MLIRIVLLCLFLGACSTSDDKEYLGNAHPAAYAADSFHIQSPTPQRSPAEDSRFYFKECDATDYHSYYSNTSYFCDEY